MKPIKAIAAIARLLAALLLAAALAGCAAGETPAPDAVADTALTVTDMTGRTVSLDAPAARIVALSPADCEILYALGAADALVGRGEYCDYPAAVAEVPSVQSGYEANLERIIALAPQVLLMTKMGQTEAQVAALEAAGVRVVVSDAQDIEGVYRAVTLIGALTGREAAAEALVADMQAALAQLAERAAGRAGGTVYFEVSPLEYGLWAAGADTFMNEAAALLGLENIFSDLSGWAAVSEEQVIGRNPDYIVTVAMDLGEGPAPAEEILARPGWQGVTAVQDGAVLHLQNDALSRPGPRIVDGVRALWDFVDGAAQEHAA